MNFILRFFEFVPNDQLLHLILLFEIFELFFFLLECCFF